MPYLIEIASIIQLCVFYAVFKNTQMSDWGYFAWKNAIFGHCGGGYSGIGYHCKDEKGNIIGSMWPEDGIISNDLEMKFKYKIQGEKYGPIRTDIMREFKNPLVKGTFFSENTIWFQIAEKYKKIYFNKAVRVYEVQPDSVTTHVKKSNTYNAESRYYAGITYINRYSKWFIKYDKLEGLKQVLRIIKYGVVIRKNLFLGRDAIIQDVKPMSCKLIIFFTCWLKPLIIILR